MKDYNLADENCLLTANEGTNQGPSFVYVIFPIA